MYDNILLPTDGSENAERAVEQAIGLANGDDAILHVLYVVDVKHMVSEVAENVMSKQLEQTGNTVVDDIAERADRVGVNVNSSVLSGTPSQEILTYAEEHEIDLIVMGTRGRTGFNRLLLGSVTEKVVRLSDAPVLTVRMTRSEADDS